MANILEQIRDNLTGANLGFKQELISSLVRSKVDENDIRNRLGNFKRTLRYRFQIIDNDLNNIN